MGKLHTKDVLGNILKDQSFRLVHWLSVTRISAKDQSRIHHFGKKVLPGLFLGYALYAGRNLERRHFGRRHWGIGKDGRIGHLLKKTQCKGGNISRRKWKNLFPIADGRIKLHGWNHVLRTSTLIRERPIRGETHEDFLGESEGSLPPPQDSFPDAGEAINDFWSMSGNFRYRHHVEPRVKLYSPREESLPIPLKYIDVSRTTHTNLDVKQEKRIDDYWNVDGVKKLVWSLDRVTQFTLLEEKPPDGYVWSGERLTRRQVTSRPDHLWPELWIKLGRKCERFITIWQALWRIILESSNSYTSSIRDKRNCRTSCTSSKRRNISRIIAIRMEWKLAGWFYAMVLLLAKCPRPPGRRENSVWKTIWRTIQRASNSIWSNGWIWHVF